MKKLFLAFFGIISTAVVAYSQTPPQKSPQTMKILQELSASDLKEIVRKLVSFGTRHTSSDTISDSRGIGAARRWIASEFQRYAKKSDGRMSVEYFESIVPISERIPKPTNVVDVVATLRPADQSSAEDRVFIVGGHYDSRVTDVNNATSDAPGADDDGSGTALTMELAKAFSKYRFNATIKFIAFAGEEQGLYGSAAWAQMAKEKGLDIEAVFNNDIVGNTVAGNGTKEDRYVRLFSEAYSPVDTGVVFRFRNQFGLENDGGSRSLARYIEELDKIYNPQFGVRLVYRLDRFGRGGDQWSFHSRGFSAVRFSEVAENYDRQHQDIRTENGKQYGDLPQYMNYEYLLNVARSNAAALATLAAAPARPQGAELVAQLGYDSVLRWKRSPDVRGGGYYVRYRQTISPVWEKKIFTRDTTITLHASKDEHLFGIQAVDRDGNVSLVAIPRPVGR